MFSARLAFLGSLFCAAAAHGDAVTCGPSTGDAFYVPPKDLPKLGPDTLGTILRCEWLGDVAPGDLSASRYWTSSSQAAAANGVVHYRILYLSQGPIGTPAVVSATVYLPKTDGGQGPGKCAKKWPIAAVQHGTTGIGDACAPSKNTFAVDYMAAPLVGRGMAVVATDYEGLGTPGVHPYLVGEAAAYSTLDGVRALSRLRDARFEAGCVGNDVIFVGHSQGGHATLFAEQYARSYGMGDGKVARAAVAWAPGFGSRTSAEGIQADPKTKNHAAITFYAMFLWGASHYYGAPADADWLTPHAREIVPPIIDSECGLGLLGDVPAQLPTVGELFTQKFLDGEASCSPTAASCPGFEPWASYIAKTIPGQFKATAPTLIVQGDADQIVQPATTQCIADRMQGQSKLVDLCALPRVGHLEIVNDSWSTVVPWLDDALAGKRPAAPKCGATLPTCPAP